MHLIVIACATPRVADAASLAATGSYMRSITRPVVVQQLDEHRAALLQVASTIGNGGVETMTKALAANEVLTSLDVGGNSLTEEAALGIVRVERQRNKLTSLGLARCGIGPTGAAEIAEYVSGSGADQTRALEQR